MSVIDLKSCTPQEIEDLMVKSGEKPFRGRQLSRWIFHHNSGSINSMTNLPKSLRSHLMEHFTIFSFPSVETFKSLDQSEKFIFHLPDGCSVEGVAIPDKNKVTFCISTQVGCPALCSFCVTGSIGYRRNLTCGEIVEQFLVMKEHINFEFTRINVVLMGMGEPLLNYGEVTKFLTIALGENGFNLSGRRITLSTIGIIPKLVQFGQEWPNIQLAVSLNAGDQTVRSQLMPISRKYSFDDLISVLENYPLPNRRRITIEYVLLEGVNSSDEQAVKLAKAVQNIPCKINLIPYNQVDSFPYRRPKEETIESFGNILRKTNLPVMIRRSRGEDISAACGQLGNSRCQDNG